MNCSTLAQSKVSESDTHTEKDIRELSDNELLFRVQQATRSERAMTIQVLHHLNEIEHRKLYLELGYSSLFDYCARRLKYSTSAAARRIQSARCVRRYPELVPLLHDRELSLSTISLIAPILNDQNKDAVLARVRGRSHREVETLVSEYRPPIALRDRMRPVRVVVAEPASLDVDEVLFRRELSRVAQSGGNKATPGAGSINVATEQKLFVQFLASEDLIEKFEQARALLSHRYGNGSFAEILEVLVTEFVARRSPVARQERRVGRRVAATRKAEQGKDSSAAESGSRRSASSTAQRNHPPRCRSNSGESHRTDPKESGVKKANHYRRRECNSNNLRRRSRHIPAKVRDAIVVRDGGECTFVARDGTRCGAKRALQVDHVRPFAAGGSHEPDNLRLLCAQHNRLAAERTLGKHAMKRFWRLE